MKLIKNIGVYLLLASNVYAEELVEKQFEASDLASFLNLYAASFNVPASGQQKQFGSRLVVYIDGKKHASSVLHFDGTTSGKEQTQDFSIIFEDVDEGLSYWMRHNQSSWRGLLKIDGKLRPNTFSPIPRWNSDGSITFAIKDKDNTSRIEDWAPSTGHLVIVMEAEEG